MQKYVEQNNHWKEGKALGFFLNFIKNHKGTVNDNDTFLLVASLRTHGEWIDLIRNAFSEEKITRMEHNRSGYERLDFDDPPKEMIRTVWCNAFARDTIHNVLTKIGKETLKRYPVKKYTSESFAQKAAELQKTLKLSDFELDVLLVLAFVQNDLLCISDGHSRHTDLTDKQVYVSKCLDCDVALVREALNDKNKLRRYNCIDEDLDFRNELNSFLNGVSKEPLSSTFYTRCQDEVLPWEFYGSLSEKHGDILKKIISSANENAPTNILLYGAPGTGKTSFAKTLANELKRDCYMILQSVCGGRGPARSIPEYRFGALEICAGQIDPANSVIIVDEADEMLRGKDDLFAFLSGGGRSAGDKGLLNSVLDTVRVPTIWITNTPAGALDESSRRRFDYSIRFEPLSTAQRQAIWRNNVSKMKLEHLVSDDMQKKFSSIYPVSAGGITLTLQNLTKLSPKPDEVETTVEKLIAPHCELLGIAVSKNDDKLLPAKDYSLDGLNIKGNLSLNRIVEAIRNFQAGSVGAIDRPRMNLLLSGAPGTGKTEFVKYLGSVLNTKVVVKMGSDLLNMYVGGTEHNIRCAFEEAEKEHAILFLDEIDGLVQNRERSMRSWEVTQVNELLYRMENFNGVMVGATNFSANLDSAILRRFTFKLEFDYLDDAGKRLFFERMFRSALTQEEERELAAIPMLAPGDFRTVRQSFFYLGSQVGNRDYLDALARESEVKNANRFAQKKPIGF